jgi:hypothetical protein
MTSHHDSVASDDALRSLAYATFTITGDRVLPDFWTAYFGIDPDIAVTKGAAFVTPSGRTSSTPGRTGVWGITSKSVVKQDRLDPHLRYLLTRLRFPRDDLGASLQQLDASMRFLCFWNNRTSAPNISLEIEKLIAACGGTVEIDVYPQKHAFRSKDGDFDVLV